MDEIVHYRFVNEKFRKSVEVEIEDKIAKEIELYNPADPTSDEFGFLKTKQIQTQKRIDLLPITLDEMKDLMSKNQKIHILRETIVVSENPIKNTISFKRYSFQKALVNVKKIERKKFKILYKNMVSLTINKINGDFSLYVNDRINGKQVIKVRKNISYKKLRATIHNRYCLSGDSPDQLEEATIKFYELLGYEPLLNYKDFMLKYLPPKIENTLNPKEKYSLPYLPFLNYIKKKNISGLTYEILPLFEFLFKKDKSKFFNKPIDEYIKFYYGLNKFKFGDEIIKRLYEYTDDQLIVSLAKYSVLKGENKAQHTFSYPGVDRTSIHLLNYFNINSCDSKMGMFINDDFHNPLIEIGLPLYRIIDLYNFNPLEIIETLKREKPYEIKRALDDLHYFYTYGIKIKVNRLSDFIDMMKEYLIQKIVDGL